MSLESSNLNLLPGSSGWRSRDYAWQRGRGRGGRANGDAGVQPRGDGRRGAAFGILKFQTNEDLNRIGVIKLPALIAASVLVPLRAIAGCFP